MARSYERPIIEVAEGLSEGVFMASGGNLSVVLYPHSSYSKIRFNIQGYAALGTVWQIPCNGVTSIQASNRNACTCRVEPGYIYITIGRGFNGNTSITVNGNNVSVTPVATQVA